MKLDCTVENYAQLYGRWLSDPGKLLDVAEMVAGERVIDLCGGTGIVAREAIARGAKTAFVVDLNPRLDFEDYRAIPPIRGKAEHVDYLLYRLRRTMHELNGFKLGPKYGLVEVVPSCRGDNCRCQRYAPDFDLVVCRQAINYLDISDAFRGVAEVLRPGGRFAFNTFVNPPRAAFKRYTFDGERYYEASFRFRQRIYHLQASPRYGYDITRFVWIPEERIETLLARHFDIIKKLRTEKSVTYVASKR
jgi:SAM-dependent methyltransferase